MQSFVKNKSLLIQKNHINSMSFRRTRKNFRFDKIDINNLEAIKKKLNARNETEAIRRLLFFGAKSKRLF